MKNTNKPITFYEQKQGIIFIGYLEKGVEHLP